jgi:hypothetical protein
MSSKMPATDPPITITEAMIQLRFRMDVPVEGIVGA